MTDEEKSKKESSEPVLDSARAQMLRWATKPETEQEKLTSSRITPIQPYAFSCIRNILDYWEQLCNATFLKSKKKEETFDSKKHLPEGVKFNPRIHYHIDEEIDCEFGSEFVNDILSGSVGVGADRAKMVLETTRDIGRPQTGLFGGLGAMLFGKDQEMDQPEEIPAFE